MELSEQPLPGQQSKAGRLFNRNFVLLWQGQLISQLGNQVHYIATMLWIKHATESASIVGTLMMIASIPGIVLGPIGGAFADRHSRRLILVLSDAICGAAVLMLAAFMFLMPNATDALLIALFTVAVIRGTVASFFGPAISAAIPDLVPKERVGSANSLNQSSIQVSMFAGQGIGGVLFRLLGAPTLFLANGISYIIAAISEFFVTIPQTLPDKGDNLKTTMSQLWQDVVEGFRFVWARKGLRSLVISGTVLNFFTAPIGVLLPFYVEDHLKASSDWFGFILAAIGVGALLGYLLAGAVKLRGKQKSGVLIAMLIVESCMLASLGLLTTPTQATVVMFFFGVLNGIINISIMTTLQLTTPGEMRGRVFGLLATLAGGLMPIAMGLAGVIADLTGRNIPLIFLVCGLATALVSILVSFGKEFRSFLES
jgi:MFS family permease